MSSGNRSWACYIGWACLIATRPSALELAVSHNYKTLRPCLTTTRLQHPHPDPARASTNTNFFLSGMLALVHWYWYSVYVYMYEPDTDQSTLDCILLHLTLLHHSLHPHDLFFTFFYLISFSIVGTASKLLVIHTNTFVHCIKVKIDKVEGQHDSITVAYEAA